MTEKGGKGLRAQVPLGGGVLVGGGSQGGDGDETEALAAAGGENLWQSLNAAGWVGDTVVEDDDGSRGEILCYEPADVPHRRMQRIVRVRGAKRALVVARSRKPELPGPRYATGRAKELRSCRYTEDFLGLFQVTDEVGIGVEQKRTVREVVVGKLVSSGFDTRNQLGLAERALANQEESGRGVVLLENLEDLGREDRVRAVIKREGNEGAASANAVGEICRYSF